MLLLNRKGVANVNQSLFASVDTLDASNFLRAVHNTNGTTDEHFVMPVNSFEQSGQPATVNGYGQRYSLYLTLDAMIVNGQFTTLNSELWADPGSNDGSISVSFSNDPSFSKPGNLGDVLLATGTLYSASLTTIGSIRTADFVETMTPTKAGTAFLGGSIQDGTRLEEQLTTNLADPSVFQTSPDGTVNTVTNGEAVIKLASGQSSEEILLPSVPSSVIHGTGGPRFIHH
jgi:hypothetical protein